MQRKRLLAPCFLLLLILCIDASATTGIAAAQPYSGIGRSTLIAKGKTEPYGPAYWYTGYIGYSNPYVYRTLITWDFSNVPQEAQVDTATLWLKGSVGARAGSPDTAEIYRIKVPYVPETATWFKRNASDYWDTGGLIGGADVDTAPIASFSWPADFNLITVDITSAVQNWVDGTWNNYGAVIRYVDENDSETGPKLGFATNGNEIETCPVILIIYTVPAPAVESLEQHLSISFPSAIGYDYRIKWSTDQVNWGIADTVTAVSDTTTWTDRGGPGRTPSTWSDAGKRFYDVEVVQ